jgi:hypothetical protein
MALLDWGAVSPTAIPNSDAVSYLNCFPSVFVDVIGKPNGKRKLLERSGA